MPADPVLRPAWHAVVRANFRATLGLVVAETGGCLEIQRDEASLVPGRKFVPLPPRDLPHVNLGRSWFVGVLLCPGDLTARVAAWARSLRKADLSRLRFYVVAGTDLRGAMEAWNKAALPERPTFEVRGFRSFHHLFGRHHADQVYRDATVPGR